jgi:phage FluMu protein gp41
MNITEKGSLAVGVEFAGKVHRDFELKPQIVGDSVEAMEDGRAVQNDSYYGVILLARQIKKLGDIPVKEITAELVMTLTEVDFQILMEKKEALEKRLRSFRGEEKDAKADNPGAA